MLSVQEQLSYDEIEIKVDKCLSDNNSIDALLLLKRKLDLASNIDEICNLMLLQSWIYFKFFSYYDIAMGYIVEILLQHQYKTMNKTKILLKCYYIKSLIHLQRGEHMLCHQTIEDILNIDHENPQAKTMMEILQRKNYLD